MLVITLFVSIFSISASAETIDNNSGEAVVITDEEVPVVDTETETEIPSASDLEQTNEYLKYITGILIFFLIAFLFWAVYKFFNLFF